MKSFIGLSNKHVSKVEKIEHKLVLLNTHIPHVLSFIITLCILMIFLFIFSFTYVFISLWSFYNS